MNSIGQHPEGWDKHFVLTADIDMAGYGGTRYSVIGNSAQRFTGSFDGGAHVISNFTYSTTESVKYVGLFGQLGPGAEVRNLGLENVGIDVGAGISVAAMVGFNYRGTILNCYVTGSVHAGANSMNIGSLVGLNNRGSIVACGATCDVHGGGHSSAHGALVGYNSSGDILDCYATGPVSGGDESRAYGGLVGYHAAGHITDCYATGTIAGGIDSANLGGLVGYSEAGSIRRCQARGGVSGTSDAGGLVGYKNDGTISMCCAMGEMHGDTRLGGLVGRNDVGSIVNCYAVGNIRGVDAVGGLLGRNHKGSVSTCYASGSICGSSRCGGLVGNEDRGSYLGCFWDSDTNPGLTGIGDVVPDPCGVTGRTTAQMQTQGNFTAQGWDFLGEKGNGEAEVWRLCMDGVYYPSLSCQCLAGDLVCPDGVGFDDLEYFAVYWLYENCHETPECSRADLNKDGKVSLQDLARWADQWRLNCANP